MATINQRIPNFLGGVSQQPDFIKFPGQLRTCHNAHPDVTFGLQKRPPGEYVGKLANAAAGGEWFEILKDDDDRYLLQVQNTTSSTPTLRIWDLADGTEKTINFTGGASTNFSYLQRAANSDAPYGKITINDYTIISNPDKITAVARTTPTFQDNYAFVSVNEIAYNSEYVIALGATSLSSTTKKRAEGVSVVKTGTSSPTWSEASSAAASTGKKTFYGTSGAMEGVKFTVTVNAVHFVNSYDGNNPNYDTQYTATVVLQESGVNCPAGSTQAVTVNGTSYTVTIDSASEYESYADANAAIFKTPKNIQKGEITIDSVLGNLKKKLERAYSNQHGSATVQNYGLTCAVAGNGLYIQTTSAFNTIAVRGGLTGDALYAFTTQAQNISKLPGSCKDGYICKVSNTDESDADDYYVKFIAKTAGAVGSGVWEETVGPGIDAGFDYNTMPHALINNNDGTFTWTSLAWADSNNNGVNDYTAPDKQYWVDRECGDDNTNPMPTFVGQSIKQLFFIRNRLGMISGGQVIISQPADYFNFFANSAISGSDADPIDIGAADVKPTILNWAIPMQKGVVVFSEAAQFMLFTESEQFSPKTAQLKKLSSYECSRLIKPVDTGTSIMFVSNTASYTKVFELIVASENAPPKVVEQTRVIPEYIPNDVNRITNSAQAGVVTLGKLTDNTLYLYKYFDSGQQREQSAWYSWGLEGTLVHQLYSSGNFYSVTVQGSEYVLQRYELIVDATTNRSYTVGTGTVGSPTTISRRFESCLDNMYIPTGGQKSYSGGVGGSTTITLPYTIQGGTSKLRLVELGDGNVRTPDSVSGTTATFLKCDLTSVNVALGYQYTTEVGLPTYYFQVDRGQYDVNADLRIHRLNLELGVSGPLEFHIESPQRDSYVHEESGIISDLTLLNKVPSALYKNISIPIYKKNNKYDLTVKIPDPFTATIVSGSWDGSLHSRRHVRR